MIKRIKTKNIYIYLSIIVFLVDLFILFVTKGNKFNDLLYSDTRDTFMDFFHSIEFLKNNNPYEQFNVIYPPFANILFRFIYMLIPEYITKHWASSYVSPTYLRLTKYDLRTYQETLIVFISILVVCILLTTTIIQKKYCGTNKIDILLPYVIVFSYGYFYSIERGNILFLCIPLLLFFIIYNDSDNKLLKEISIICLAVAANIKIYPALFGLILIKKKDFKGVVKSIAYGLLIFVFSASLLRGGGI